MNYQKLLRRSTYLIFTVILLSGCRKVQVDSIPISSTAQPISTSTLISIPPASTPIQYTRDYWPTEDWRVSTPEAQGMDPEQLLKFQQYIEQKLPDIYSVLIVRHGYLIFEQYYQGQGPQLNHSLQSVTKSFTSALIGIALKEGYLDTLDQKILDFFPEYNASDFDPQTKDITLRHLLTMTSGFRWTDPWLAIPRDPIKFAIEQPMEHRPGESFNYNTAASHILSAILTKASGMSALDFADKYLFEPLGISNRFWGVDPQGHNFGGHLLYLRPRDMAKFGYLYLNQGYWDGQQIIPAEFVLESTSKQIKASHLQYDEIYYGHLWWVPTTEEHSVYFALGYGGQLIYVVPELDLVVVITAKPDSLRDYSPIVGEFVIPATVK